MEKTMRETLKWLRTFFINYFWVGIVLILSAILLDNIVVQRTLPKIVGISILNNIGIAILVASIFTFASGTSQFVDKITELLKDIVIDRNFLGNIDSDSKRNALNALIKPSEAEKQVYSDIGRYYDMYTSHTMNISSKSVRSDYSVYAIASIDNKLNKVKCNLLITYRLHPSVDGYKDIKIKVDDKPSGSEIRLVRVSTPSGKRVYDQKPESNEEDLRGNKTGSAIVPLKELGEGHTHLKVEIELIEYGQDHWILQTFQALEPTDGFRFRLECRDNLKVVAQNSFIYGAEFHVDRPNEKIILFSCDEWMNEGSGLAVVVSFDGAIGVTEKSAKPDYENVGDADVADFGGEAF